MKVERKLKEKNRHIRRDERQGDNRKEWEGQAVKAHDILERKKLSYNIQ